PELALSYYYEMGIPVPAVIEYIMTLLNSNFEEWRRANPDKSINDFPFSPKKMSVSGSLFDMEKLSDVCKQVISRMSADEVYDYVSDWAAQYDPAFAALFTRDPEMTKEFLSIGRGGKKPRKDIEIWSTVKQYMDFMFDELFRPDYSGMPERVSTEDAKAILTEYADIFDPADEMTVWFDKVKELASQHGYAPETKLYKKNPDDYKGPVGDISMVLRVAVCGRTNAPDLYSVMQLLGADKVRERLARCAQAL
ncbi:MAG: glutamate--tRNA ligase, partial [Clostridiales bacterium]|nr:glutamate--tRNA ligase [Clostridiales bacterium]